MIYDRPYMKTPSNKHPKLGVIPWLLISLVVVFLMQKSILIFFGPRLYQLAIQDIFVLSSQAVESGKIWTLISYGFLHDTQNIFHLLGNGVGIFFVGRMVARIFGERALLETFFLATFTGGLLAFIVHINDGILILGASGALMGILTLFCLARPNEEITLLLYFIIPITIKPKWLLWVALGVSALGMLFQELPKTSPIAHSAHLGGMLGGWLYFLMVSKGKSFEDFKYKMPFKSPKVVVTPPKAKAKPKKMGYSINFTNKEKLKAEVDKILDKINTQGFGSLTQEERETLDKARDLLGKGK